MNEKDEALAYSQLLLLHADTITDSGVKEMVVNSAAELTILHLRVEALRLENERLREALELAFSCHGKVLMSDPPQDAWKFNRVDEVINAALRREET